MSALRVLVDGAALDDEAARAFWGRFSAYMEDHKGDLAGFAKLEGLASVRPEVHDGAPVLAASTTAPQAAYVTAPKKTAHASSGSRDPRRAGGAPQGARRSPKKRG